jgi:immune inhibitor A
VTHRTTRRRRLIAIAAAGGLLVGGALAATPTAAANDTGDSPLVKKLSRTQPRPDIGTGHLPEHPVKLKHMRDEQRAKAMQRKLRTGKAFKDVRTAKKKGEFVELEREGTDRIFVVLAEFGEERYPHAFFQDDWPGIPDPQPERFDGPARNEIPEPDRSIDNSTLWQEDYDREHYQDMYFNRMATYFEKQSSGRYSVEGDVTEWVTVPYNQALYGRDYCGDIVCDTTKMLVRDALAVWVQNELDSGKTMAQIQEYLRTFDVEDRYDADFDGNFDEPDGFIDHFQIVHAGGDQAAGDPTYGSDAIWSHRWYANLQATPNPDLPGVEIGTNDGFLESDVPSNPTGIYVGDYTIQPENGGLGVFAHEFAHDLDLPDLYDTSGNTGGAENSTAFWTLMSSGANIGDGGPDGIGDNPTDLGAWELLQLGWMDPVTKNGLQTRGPFYEVAQAGERSTHRLGSNVPAPKKGAQAVFTLLPNNVVDEEIGTPDEGQFFWYSGSGNNLDNAMTNLDVTGDQLTARVNYDIENHWDYAFLEATTDGGASWEPVLTNLSDPAANDLGDFNDSGTGITGLSNGWVDLTATLPADTSGIRFRYLTDVATVKPGFQVDDVKVDGTSVGNAETEDEGWTLDGFIRTDGTELASYFHAYVLENRQYDGYDKSLKTAYNFGFLGTNRPDWVESYPYQNGMLVTYWNEQYGDNNVGDHPGGGMLLPVDSHPGLLHWKDGTLMRPRIASYDSTFGPEPTQSITLHLNGVKHRIKGQKAVRTFDDTKSYWTDSDSHGATGDHPGRYQPGWYSVKVPNTGTTIKVVKKNPDGSLQILVAPKG